MLNAVQSVTRIYECSR